MASPPFKVKAVFEYTSPHEDDLHFPNGQIITVTGEEDDDWYAGEYVDTAGVTQEGIFPKNFVEKYEPTAPPRPTRVNRPKKEAEPAPEPVAAPEPVQEPEVEPEPQSAPEEVHEAALPQEPPASNPDTQVVPVKAPKASVASPVPVAKAPSTSDKPSAPSSVSDTPASGSFRDRIAAFNKKAPPPAPAKPGGLGSSPGGSSYLVRKPFVAPPPSKNAYVPVSREPPPQKIYRREEDPEIAAQQTENLEQAERSGLVPKSNDDNEEDQPKPTSLKERIALLQKQQMEQAARHTEAVQKKEKPKKPAKKHTDTSVHSADVPESEDATVERTATNEIGGRASVDSTREVSQAQKRKSLKGPPTQGIQPRKSFGDGNETDMSGAGETFEEPEEIPTSKDGNDEGATSQASAPPPARAAAAPSREADVGEEEGATEEEPLEPENDEDDDEEEAEEDIDPEVRRREELRARMAKMSGGMGMHGMFGPPGGMPMPVMAAPKKKVSASSERRIMDEDDSSAKSRAPPMPMIPLPGLSRVKSAEAEQSEESTPISDIRSAEEVPDVEDVVPQGRAAPPVPIRDAAPPIPGGRPAPPPVPKETRPPTATMTSGADSESDDEDISTQTSKLSMANPPMEAPRPPQRPEVPMSPNSPLTKRASYFGSEVSPTSPTQGANSKRASRLPPPVPGGVTTTQSQNRAPPPPPPGSLSRTSTGDHRPQPPPVPAPSAPEASEGEVTEYEGDYDTDIASAAPPKESLKSHARNSSIDDDVETLRSPVTSPLSGPPPLPPTAAPRGAPPSLPPQPPPRQSVDVPRGAPPPPPPGKQPAPWEQDDDEYDPYNYSAPKAAARSIASSAAPTPRVERTEEDLYTASPPRQPPPTQDRAPPPPPREEAPKNVASRAPPRQSLDVSRSGPTRRSTELGRISMDSGYIANDVDLAPKSFWWTQPRTTPPVFNGQRDVLYHFEESSSPENGVTTITKEVSVLFQDYSQTIITAEFDAQNPSDVQLSQRHEPPPSRVRQEYLESAHENFGRSIHNAVHSKKETVVGDGTPHGLVTELLRPFPAALPPIGTRAYGALVYANMGNASTTQNDEIRPGDIISLRNTKFQGKHGPMHAKYSVEIGKPEHVAVVAEWDGTKKKIRAWEQGRESKKVRLESFKLDDLRSGEVKVWRVMPRSWVGWHNGGK